MLETFQTKVEKVAERYADMVLLKIEHAMNAADGGNAALVLESLEEMNEGIRMLNHAACALERISRIQKEHVCGGNRKEDVD